MRFVSIYPLVRVVWCTSSVSNARLYNAELASFDDAAHTDDGS